MLAELLGTGLALVLVGCSSVPITSKRCSFDNLEYSAHVATCRQRIEAECLLNPDGTPVESCPVLRECDAWRVKECSDDPR
jgi:hypothetical protein